MSRPQFDLISFYFNGFGLVLICKVVMLTSLYQEIDTVVSLFDRSLLQPRAARVVDVSVRGFY